MKLRPYQSEMVDGAIAAFRDNAAVLLVMPTGTGKTVCFGHVIKTMMERGRVMVLAHRSELLTQAAEKIARIAGVMPDIERANQYANESMFPSRVIVGSIQTQIAQRGEVRRMHRFLPSEFSLLVVDECFPGCTMVGGKPISEIRIGDSVVTHRGRKRSVRNVFVGTTNRIVEIRFGSGRRLACTPGHPVATPFGFVPAGSLTPGSMVHTITQHDDKMYSVRCSDRKRKEVVRASYVPVGIVQTDDPGQLQKARRRDNQVSENERHARSGSAGQGFVAIADDGMEADRSRGEWYWGNDSSIGDVGGARMAMRGSSSNSEAAGQWIPDVLQAGRCESRPEDWNRGRREFARGQFQESARREKGCFFGVDWVDRVTIHERGDSREFERLCPKGIVYNLHIEDDETYVAEDIVVHNCHHCTATSYRNVIDHYRSNPKLRVLGVTATPDRTDEAALGQVFDCVLPPYGIVDAIQDGWLVPIRQGFRRIHDLDFTNVGTVAGDFNAGDLAAIMERERPLHEVCSATLDIAGERRTLVFASSVAHAEKMTEIFNRHREGCATIITGKTPDDEREKRLRGFKCAEIQYLVNVGVYTEGADLPGVEVVVIARPTKSRSLYAQMIGRGTRPYDAPVDDYETPEERRACIANSCKPFMEIVDVVGVSGQHKLVYATDILGGNCQDESPALAANAIREKGQAVDVLEELARQRFEAHERQKAAEASRKLQLKAKVSYTTKWVDPFEVLDVSAEREHGWDVGKELSDAQAELLESFGVAEPRRMDRAKGSVLIDELIRRRRQGFCTFKQAKLLKRYGCDPAEFTFTDASAAIDAIAKNGWRKPLSMPVGVGSPPATTTPG